MFADSVIQKLNPTTQSQDIVNMALSFKNFGYVKEATFLMLEVCKRMDFSDASGAF